MSKNLTYKDLIIEALENLGGKANLDSIYKEVERLAKIKGKNLPNDPNNFKASVRATLERNSSDSETFNGKDDLFYSVDGNRE